GEAKSLDFARGDQHRPGSAKRSHLPHARIESAASRNFSPLNPLFSLHFAIFLQNFSPDFIPALRPALIMPAIALAGTGSGPGIREGDGDLPLRVGSGGPEGS